MLKANDKIKVHLYDTSNREIHTRHINTVFTVYEKAGKLGIDWNTERSPYTCRGDIFTPFYTFASNVIFEDVETGENYHFSNIENDIVMICNKSIPCCGCSKMETCTLEKL